MKKILITNQSPLLFFGSEALIIIQLSIIDPSFVNQVVSFDGIKIIWSFGPSQYAIRPLEDFGYYVYLNYFSKDFSKKNFISQIKELYPEDFEFFLWHPEVEYGVWNK